MARQPQPPNADADILAHLQARNYRAAFELLLPRQRDSVFRLALSMLGNRAAAEDVAQDVMLRVWRALPGYNGKAALGTWIYAITRNACVSEFRRRKPEVSIHAGAGASDDEAPAFQVAAPEHDDTATTSVQALLAELPERYRQAVTLFYMEDKSYDQTALALGLPLGTVKALLHRARKRLADLAREEKK